jgi:hypothetical protein
VSSAMRKRPSSRARSGQRLRGAVDLIDADGLATRQRTRDGMLKNGWDA